MIRTCINKLAEFIKTHKKILIISSTIVLSIVACVTAVLCLVLPVVSKNFVDNTFEVLFSDVEYLSDIGRRLEKKGYESEISLNMPATISDLKSDLIVKSEIMGYGSGEQGSFHADYTISVLEKEHRFSLSSDENAFYLSGYDAEGKDIGVYLPIKNILEAMESSVFNPESKSKFALNNTLYNKICELLDGENTIEVEEIESLGKSIKSRLNEQLNEESKIVFAESAIGLKRVVSASLDSDDLVAIVDILKEELLKEEDIAKAFSLNEEGLEASFNNIKQSLETVSLEYSYTVKNNMISNAHIVLTKVNINNKDRFEILFESEKKVGGASFTLTLANESGPSYNIDRVETVIKYEKTSKLNKTNITVDFTKISDYGKTIEENQFDIIYNKLNGKYQIEKSSSNSDNTEFIEGKFERFSNNDGIYFSVDKYTTNEGEYSELLSIKLKKNKNGKRVEMPVGENLLEMSEEKINELIDSIYFEGIMDTWKNLYDTDLTMSEDGLPIIYSNILLQKLMYEQLFMAHRSECTYYSLPKIDKAYVYIEEAGIYLLMDYSYKGIGTKLYYFPGELLNDYHFTEIADGKFVVHDYQVVEETFADCYNDGYITKKCSICDREYKKQTENQQGHSTKTVTFEFTYDVDNTNEVLFYYCTKCNDPQRLELDDYLNISLSRGGMVNSTYGTVKHIIIPDEITDICDMTDFCINPSISGGYNILSIRIPDGKEVVRKDDFVGANNLQVVVIPGSVKEIQDGSFYAEAPMRRIFYIGTEEEWNEVNINGYADEWARVEIVFAPDGVCNNTVMKSCIDTTDSYAALVDKKIVVESIDRAKELALNNEDITLIYDGLVSLAAYDALTDTISIAEVSDNSTIIKFFTSDGYLLDTFKIKDVITIMDSDGGLLAFGSANNNLIYLYDIQQGSFSYYEFTEFDCTFDSLFVDEDRVIFVADDKTSSGENLYILFPGGDCRRIKRGVSTERFEYFREYHKIVSVDWTNSQVSVYDTVGGIIANNLLLTSIKSNQYMTKGYFYAYSWEWVSNAFVNLYYDFEMNECKTRPDSIWTEISLGSDALEIEQLITSKKGRASMILDKDGEVSIAICGADSDTAILIDYYAESGRFTSDGDAILYTPGGFGLILVNINE